MFKIIVYISHILYIQRLPLERIREQCSAPLFKYTLRPITRQSRPLELEEELRHSAVETGERVMYVANRGR
jgi:hypothetical protein